MEEFIRNLVGDEYALTAFWGTIVLAVIVGLAILWLLFRLFTRPRSAAGRRAKKARLAVTDAAAIDTRRRLVLLRRDDVEHLIMIGGPTDMVIESDIRRNVAARPLSQGQSNAKPQAAPQRAASVAATPVPKQDVPAAVAAQDTHRQIKVSAPQAKTTPEPTPAKPEPAPVKTEQDLPIVKPTVPDTTAQPAKVSEISSSVAATGATLTAATVGIGHIVQEASSKVGNAVAESAGDLVPEATGTNESPTVSESSSAPTPAPVISNDDKELRQESDTTVKADADNSSVAPVISISDPIPEPEASPVVSNENIVAQLNGAGDANSSAPDGSLEGLTDDEKKGTMVDEMNALLNEIGHRN